MYEEFEKLNCQHIQELNKQNANIMKVFDINDVIQNDNCKDSMENDLMRKPFIINGSCIKRENDDTNMKLCHGYDCSTKPFYQTPDKLNTYHNYLVLQDDLLNDTPYSCTENHQHFFNWTRRKLPVQQEEREAYDMGFYDKYLERIPSIRYTPCPTDKIKYYC